MTKRPFRKLSNQVDELLNKRGIYRRNLAQMMGVHESYISQIIARGGTASHIEQISLALDVDPFHFDRYHVLTLLSRVESGDEWAQEIASLLIDGRDWSKSKQRQTIKNIAA
jgi:transcriptional regulator with XRE-family HTH domain